MPVQGDRAMDSSQARGVVSCVLPPELIERVLSFLSVPELCRMRLVCKSWNESICRASFHDLCEQNGGNGEYLFMWSEVTRRAPPRVVLNPILSDTLSFIDIDARRWYSIPPPRARGRGHEVESRYMAVNDGLVCELTTARACASNKFALSIFDPVARTRRSLPAPPKIFVADDSHLVSAQIVTTVDNATRSYKVFLLNNLAQYTNAPRAQPQLYVHESFTNNWRILRNLPNELQEQWAVHAIVLHGSLFLLKEHSDSRRLSLFRYRVQEDTWAEVYRMRFSSRRNNCVNPTLVVSGNRLFLNVWFGGSRSSDPNVNPTDWKSDPDCPEPGSFSTDTGTHFEMYEVLVADNRRKLVVRLAHSQLEQIFGRHLGSHGVELNDSGVDDYELKMSYAFPCVSSNGICNSVVLVSIARCQGFELRRYELATGSVDVLPPHPLVRRPSMEPIGEYYTVENMKLSLRNLLAQRPKKLASTG